MNSYGMMALSRGATFRIALGVKPWRELPMWSRFLPPVAYVVGIGVFSLVFLHTRSLQWGVLLTLPTIIAGLAGGVVLGLAGALVASVVPIPLSVVFGIAMGGDLAILIVATAVFLLFGGILGYVSASTISLRSALNEVRALKGILPICAHCKRVRDGNGYWRQVEEYISEHSEIEFSHGFCDDCMQTLYPEVVQARKGTHMRTTDGA